MSIDINNLNAGRPDAPKRQDGKQAVAEAKATSTQDTGKTQRESSTNDNVSLSSTARNLAQIESELKSLPEVDQARVDEIKARIDNGSYSVDADSLAQKLLDME